MDDLALAADFPAATHEAWMAAVERVLKGAPFERALVGRTYDGLAVQPLYARSDASPIVTGHGAAPWRVAARVDHPDPVEANRLLLADLEGGADAVTIVLAGAASARGFGLADPDLESLDRALGGVMLDLVALRLEAGAGGRVAAALLIALAERRGQAPGALDLDLGLDPIGAAASSGRMPAPWPAVGTRLAETLSSLSGRGFAGRLALADGRPYHEAGASEAEELAATLATALAYLRAFEAGGHDLDAARGALSFLLVADADAFLTVAKFRALRVLWARVESACGLAPRPIRLHAETAYRMTTRRDPWVNVLRGTLAAFSAGIGGADSIAVLPFTSALGLPDGFARRLARNTQQVLIEEACLARVADPVAGSGAFETLTADLAEAAWARFTAIEREGGIVASLAAGAIQSRLAATAERRRDAVAARRDPLTGTSEFADLREVAVAVLAPPPGRRDGAGPVAIGPAGDFDDLVAQAAAGGAAASLPAAPMPDAPAFAALPSVRLAEPFERLRDRSDRMLAGTGARPGVFLANLGPLASFSARATYARNAFAACGIEAAANEGFASLEEMVGAFRRSGVAAACLCSSDRLYGELAVPAAEALRAAGAERIYLAGRPAGLVESLTAAGIGGFLHTGCDLPALAAGELATG